MEQPYYHIKHLEMIQWEWPLVVGGVVDHVMVEEGTGVGRGRQDKGRDRASDQQTVLRPNQGTVANNSNIMHERVGKKILGIKSGRRGAENLECGSSEWEKCDDQVTEQDEVSDVVEGGRVKRKKAGEKEGEHAQRRKQESIEMPDAVDYIHLIEVDVCAHAYMHISHVCIHVSHQCVRACSYMYCVYVLRVRDD